MRKIVGFVAVVALFASTQAFAIGGAGVHYVMNTGSLKSSEGSVQKVSVELPDGPKEFDIKLKQGGVDGLQGIGFKLWLDLIPVIDIEAGLNVAAGRYKTTLIIPNPSPIPPNDPINIDLGYKPDAPYSMLFDEASPVYGFFTGDVSITYPFVDKIPFVRPYVGVGFSYFVGIPVLDNEFAKKVISEEVAKSLFGDGISGISEESANKIGKSIGDELKNADYSTGIGGHVIVGARIKPPIIPLAVYTNVKYYFGGDIGPFTQGVALEVGGGFAL